MKVNVNRMSKSERDKFRRSISVEINDQMGQVIKDREMMAGCRAQWMLLAGLCEEFGFGKKRLRRLLLKLESMVPGLCEDREAEVMDEVLISYLERIGLDIRDTHGEYFDCAGRLKEFGKFLEGEKEEAKEKAKEKELNDKLQRRNMVLGKGN